MRIGETLLVFGGIPLAVILVVTAWAFAASSRSVPRYRPGRPFVFTPVWYLAETAPSQPGHPDHKALPPGLTGAAELAAIPPPSGAETGGAGGTW